MIKPKLNGLSDMKRAQIFTRYKRIDALMETGGSLSRFLKSADAHYAPLIDLRDTLTAAGNHSTQGITAELEKPKAATRAELSKVKADVQAQAEKIAEQAASLESKTFEFDDNARRDLDLFLSLPTDQRSAVKDQILAGKHEQLARALIAAPAFATDNILTTHAREIIRSKLIPADEMNEIMERARNHAAVLDHIDDCIRSIDEM